MALPWPVFNSIDIHRIMLNTKKGHSSLIVVTFKHDFLVIVSFPCFWLDLLEDFDKEFQEQNLGVKSRCDWDKVLLFLLEGQDSVGFYRALDSLNYKNYLLWCVSPKEKVKYYDIASEKRIEFDRAMAKFNNKMVSNHSFSLLLSCLLFARLWNIQFIFCCLAGKWGSLTKLAISLFTSMGIQGLGSLKLHFPDVPVMALTATATHAVREDILKALRIPHALVLERSFDRPNLKYEVIAKTKEPIKQLGQLLIDRFRNQCGIVYCLSKSECVELSKLLSEKCKIKTVYYHSGLSAHQRVAVKKKMVMMERSILYVQLLLLECG
ncbi:hypothetical protein JHK82_038389 [Glycine max]|nr:hypothetical protein JHK85_021242 [Glycine max]KAG5015107.1 hypothetical protein JHK85_021243 [Glycine max]KAG5024891.1 hypothetical protein JHK86_020805 [Glycine max]KAG5024892.1 hypothetical protein JHK86_020806 [Glycine max]KAG5115120.1 hypothetical protein JHK82_038389 [Glycine max]